jgi:ubiquitin carboxyl-terminal hydrolase 4/11/15
MFVDFPVTSLDLYDFIQDKEFLSTNSISCVYNLVGLICHFGSMKFGHYYSVVKNPLDSTWINYDDSSKTHITENQIPKHNAYILFYQRKDVGDKKMENLYPRNFGVFPGLPVTTKDGEGFVLGA